MAKKVGDLYVQLGVDSRKFRTGISKATEGLKTFGMNAMKGLAMVTAAATALGLALGKITKDTVRYGVETDRLVKLLNLTGEQVTRLRYAMEQEHGSVQALEKGIFNLTVRLGYAGDGLETYLRYFRTLGIEHRKADGSLRDTYGVFLELVDAISKGTLSTEKQAAAFQLLSARTAKELIPFMKLGREEIERLGDEAEALGLVMSTETAAAMKVLDDKITALKGSFKGFRNLIGERIAPAVTGFTDTIVNAFIQIREHIDDLLPSLANLGTDTDMVGMIGVEFAKRTVTAIFTVMNVWMRLKNVYWVVRGAFNKLIQFHNKQFQILYEITVFTLKKIATVWDKVFKTNLRATLDSISDSFTEFNKIVGDEAKDNFKKAEDAAADLNTSYEKQMEILNNLSPMTLHFTKRIKDLGDTAEETGNKIKDATRKSIAGMDEDLYRSYQAMKKLEDVNKDTGDSFEDLGKIIGDVVSGAEIDLKKLLGLALRFIFPGGGFLLGLFGGILGMGEGGITVPKGTAPVFGMQEGGVVATEPTISPGGVPFGEKGWEVFMKGHQWTEFIKSMKPTILIHNYTNRDIIVEEIKGTSESAKFELQRELSDNVLSKTEMLNE